MLFHTIFFCWYYLKPTCVCWYVGNAMCCISFIHICLDCNLLDVCLGVNCHRWASSTEEQEYGSLVRWHLPYYFTQPRERWDISWSSIVTAQFQLESFGKTYPHIHPLLFYRQRTLMMNRRQCVDLQERKRDINCSSWETNCDCLL